MNGVDQKVIDLNIMIRKMLTFAISRMPFIKMAFNTMAFKRHSPE
jgi:hypothetical protein